MRDGIHLKQSHAINIIPAQGVKKAAAHGSDKRHSSAELVDGRANSKRQPFELSIMPLAGARMHSRDGG